MPFDPLPLHLVLPLMAALAAAGVVCALWLVLEPDHPLVRRAKQMREDGAGQRREARSARRMREPFSLRRLLKLVARRFDGLRRHAGSELAEKLARAGWRNKEAVVLFLCGKIAMPFVGGVLVMVVVNAFFITDLDAGMRRLAPAVGVLLGFLVPGYIVDKAIAKREKLIGRGLPDALDLLVICAEAGLSLDFALQRVSQELAEASPEISEELSVTAVERRLLPERRTALDNLAQRCQIGSVRALVQTLIQAEQYGTPLSQSLRVVAGELRAERMLKAEEKAGKLPAKMTVPLVAFILPPLFIVLLGPGILQTLDALGGG